MRSTPPGWRVIWAQSAADSAMHLHRILAPGRHRGRRPTPRPDQRGLLVYAEGCRSTGNTDTAGRRCRRPATARHRRGRALPELTSLLVVVLSSYSSEESVRAAIGAEPLRSRATRTNARTRSAHSDLHHAADGVKFAVTATGRQSVRFPEHEEGRRRAAPSPSASPADEVPRVRSPTLTPGGSTGSPSPSPRTARCRRGRRNGSPTTLAGIPRRPQRMPYLSNTRGRRIRDECAAVLQDSRGPSRSPCSGTTREMRVGQATRSGARTSRRIRRPVRASRARTRHR